jgi:hypothetical protein
MSEQVSFDEAVYFLMGSERQEDSSGIRWFRDGRMVAAKTEEGINVRIDGRTQTFTTETERLINLGVVKKTDAQPSATVLAAPNSAVSQKV